VIEACSKWGPRVSAWFDGEASELEAREIRTHLRDCGGCRAAVNEWGAQRDLFAEIQPAPVSEVALARMTRRFESGLAAEVHGMSTALRLWTTAAAVLLLALAGSFVADRVFLPGEAMAATPRDIDQAVQEILERPLATVPAESK